MNKPASSHFPFCAWISGLALVTSVILPLASNAQNLGKGVQITDNGNSLRIQIDGELFTEYHYGKYDGKDVSRPFFYPVIGPSGAPMTRNSPMKEGKDEATDHPHHRGGNRNRP